MVQLCRVSTSCLFCHTNWLQIPDSEGQPTTVPCSGATDAAARGQGNEVNFTLSAVECSKFILRFPCSRASYQNVRLDCPLPPPSPPPNVQRSLGAKLERSPQGPEVRVMMSSCEVLVLNAQGKQKVPLRSCEAKTAGALSGISPWRYVELCWDVLLCCTRVQRALAALVHVSPVTFRELLAFESRPT